MKTELTKLHRETIPPLGVLPISVPGCVDGWAELHKKFGKLKLSDDLAPAIHTPRKVSRYDLIAYYWAFGPRLYKGLPGAFLEKTDTPRQRTNRLKGDILKNPALARTLQSIGEKGTGRLLQRRDCREYFTRSCAPTVVSCGRSISKSIIPSTWVEPVSVNYRGYDVFELPPNGQGIATLQMLNILEGFDLRAMGRNSPETLTP